MHYVVYSGTARGLSFSLYSYSVVEQLKVFILNGLSGDGELSR